MITEIYAHAARHSRIPEVRDCTADGKPVLAVSDGDSIKNEWQHATQSDAEPDGFSYLSFQGVPRTLTRVTRDSPSRLPQGLAGPPQRALRHLLALSGLFTWVHEDKIEKATSIAEGVGLFVTLKNNDLFLVQSPANPLGDSVCYDFHRSKWRNVAQIRPWSEALYTPKPRGMLTVAEANSEMHRIYEHQRKILQLRLTESLNSANSFAWSASAHSPTQFAAWQDAQLGPQTYAPALSYAGASESSAASGDNDQVRQAHTSAGDSMQAVARDFEPDEEHDELHGQPARTGEPKHRTRSKCKSGEKMLRKVINAHIIPTRGLTREQSHREHKKEGKVHAQFFKWPDRDARVVEDVEDCDVYCLQGSPALALATYLSKRGLVDEFVSNVGMVLFCDYAPTYHKPIIGDDKIDASLGFFMPVLSGFLKFTGGRVAWDVLLEERDTYSGMLLTQVSNEAYAMGGGLLNSVAGMCGCHNKGVPIFLIPTVDQKGEMRRTKKAFAAGCDALVAYGANNLLIGSVGFNGMAGNCASRSLRWLFEHGRSKSFHSAALCLPKGIHHNFDGDVIDGGFEPPTAPKLQRVHHVTPCEHIVSVTAVREAFQPRQPAR